MATTSPYNLKTNHQVGDSGLVADINEIAGAVNDADGRITNSLQPNEVTVKAARDLAITGAGTAASPLVIDSPYRWIGSGSPYGSVVPDRVGIEWIDTARTRGARAWRSTGTTSTSWVVIDGDTGVVDLTSHLMNGWTINSGGVLLIRRVGNMCSMIWCNLNGTAATSAQVCTLTSGFNPEGWFNSDSGTFQMRNNSNGLYANGTYTTMNSTSGIRTRMTWDTSESWPTSLS